MMERLAERRVHRDDEIAMELEALAAGGNGNGGYDGEYDEGDDEEDDEEYEEDEDEVLTLPPLFLAIVLRRSVLTIGNGSLTPKFHLPNVGFDDRGTTAGRGAKNVPDIRGANV
ncbi:MAG: hypothetical protein BJ554DRAFT_2852 [Olpidium bornovanus]|uniref:Uncharacterized protein n=1 Tax=Olpidium bornovanus TaxID=278681 RepID=A0A8H7ZPC0_9FUNG|nr:MAG: hypothetical protein BJ554DRAFT_2852 [Olpidium bornovanus]